MSNDEFASLIPHTWISTAFDESMSLLDEIVQILDWAYFAAVW